MRRPASLVALGLVLLTSLSWPATIMAQSTSPSVSGTPAPSSSPGPQSRTSVWQTAEAIPSSPLRVWDVVSWRHGFAALGTPPGERMRRLGKDATVWLSEDGSTWQAVKGGLRVPSDRARVTHLAAYRGGLMAFGSHDARMLAWRSGDGRRWRRVPDQPAFGPTGVPRDQGYSLGVVGAVAGDDRIVVSGAYGAPGDTRSYARVWMSRNGRTWRAATPDLPYPSTVHDLSVGPYGHQGLTAAREVPEGCEDDAALPVRTGGGLDWVVPRKSEPVCRGFSMAYDASRERYFMLGRSAGEDPVVRVLRSRDRQRWTEVYAGPSEIDGRSWSMGGGRLLTGDGVVAVVGEGTIVDAEDNEISVPWSLVSDDGKSWHLDAGWPASATDASLRDAAMGHGRLVAVATDVDGGAWYADLEALGVMPTLRVPLPGAPVRKRGQPPRFRPRGQPNAVVREDGMKLELWVKDETIDRGQWLLAHLRVTNTGKTPVRYQGSFENLACPPTRAFIDTTDVFGAGRTWTGVAADLKERFLRDEWLTKAALSIPRRDRGRSGRCPTSDIGHAPSTMAPGRVVDIPLAGMPRYALRKRALPGGTLHAVASFTGRRQGEAVSVTVKADVTLRGSSVEYPSPQQLVDTALETPGFVDALERSPDPGRWANANIGWWEAPPYPDQQRLDAARDAPNGIIEIMQFPGPDAFVAGAVLDPWTGESFGAYSQ